MMYLERLSKTGITNSEYYKFNGDDNDMPNCTRYADGRAKEECWDTKLAVARKGGGFGNAKTWFEKSPLDKGYEIKNGAIAVFDGKYGHVAVVERKISDTRALISQSQYNSDKTLRDYRFWEKREVDLIVGEATLSGVGPLIGFIYPPIDDVRVTRNNKVDQVEILEELVNVRTAPTTSAGKYEGRFCPVGIYNVLKWDEADGYTWAKLDSDCWVACGKWAKIYKCKEADPETPGEDLSDIVKQLNESLKDLKSQITSLQNENKNLTKKVETLEKDLGIANDKLDDARTLAEDLNTILK